MDVDREAVLAGPVALPTRRRAATNTNADTDASADTGTSSSASASVSAKADAETDACVRAAGQAPETRNGEAEVRASMRLQPDRRRLCRVSRVSQASLEVIEARGGERRTPPSNRGCNVNEGAGELEVAGTDPASRRSPADLAVGRSPRERRGRGHDGL